MLVVGQMGSWIVGGEGFRARRYQRRNLPKIRGGCLQF